VRRFHGDVTADAFRLDVGVGPVTLTAIHEGTEIRVVQRARLSAAARRTGSDRQRLVARLDFHRLAIRVVHLHADRILVPGLQVHVTREVVDHQLRALGHGDRLVGRRHGIVAKISSAIIFSSQGSVFLFRAQFSVLSSQFSVQSVSVNAAARRSRSTFRRLASTRWPLKYVFAGFGRPRASRACAIA